MQERRPLPFEVPRPVPVLLRSLEPAEPRPAKPRAGAPYRLRLLLWLLLGGMTYLILTLHG